MNPLLCLAALAASCLAEIDTAPSAAASPPNIVFIYADDLGPGDLGCYGGKIVPTPNIDRMAKEGTRFTQYYSASPICSPSRCGVITGNFPARWKITSYLQTKAGNRACEQADFLDPKAPSLPRELKRAGYATAHFGKWHLGGGRDVAAPPKFAAYGYDEHAGTWESPEPHPDITASNWIWSPKDKVKRWDRTAFFVDKTLDFLERNQGKPCLINLWLDDPHTPWIPSATANQEDSVGNLREVMVENDRQVGRLLNGLKSLNLDEKTLVIFVSDNGPLPTFNSGRTMGLRGSKMSLYEGGIRLPFIARWPGVVPAGRVDETTLISAVDLFPTFCRLANAPLPLEVTFDGEDRSQALRGEPQPTRKNPLFWEYGRNEKSFAYPKRKGDRSPNVAVRDANWKLLVNADGTGEELYDLEADPKETTNLAAQHSEVSKTLKERALAWRRSLP
ncbi:sulfatase family protein [Singulisphaera acidiphila]|uniref:Arylsulfatase A family protein n=1 Tax=Singulisphaera acidiphila (strain ATCC BAA-1392 / DSM 18658 / VKM B-2454 / MOB10) TaxID=886293 RepID=L0DLN9_SINAD|nr:sulfatase-like hydrolase/transferase [Singulisphaera acidiphila]AGA29758.1 arylsulfatase A family protein [Singulisphaera acidiphila DSM 18658]